MGSCPDGEAERSGGRLTARERQAPEKKERSDYRSDDPPKGRLRRVSAGGKGAEVEADGGGEAEQVQRR